MLLVSTLPLGGEAKRAVFGEMVSMCLFVASYGGSLFPPICLRREHGYIAGIRSSPFEADLVLSAADRATLSPHGEIVLFYRCRGNSGQDID